MKKKLLTLFVFLLLLSFANAAGVAAVLGEDPPRLPETVSILSVTLLPDKGTEGEPNAVQVTVETMNLEDGKIISAQLIGADQNTPVSGVDIATGVLANNSVQISFIMPASLLQGHYYIRAFETTSNVEELSGVYILERVARASIVNVSLTSPGHESGQEASVGITVETENVADGTTAQARLVDANGNDVGGVAAFGVVSSSIASLNLHFSGGILPGSYTIVISIPNATDYDEGYTISLAAGSPGILGLDADRAYQQEGEEAPLVVTVITQLIPDGSDVTVSIIDRLGQLQKEENTKINKSEAIATFADLSALVVGEYTIRVEVTNSDDGGIFTGEVPFRVIASDEQVTHQGDQGDQATHPGVTGQRAQDDDDDEAEETAQGTVLIEGEEGEEVARITIDDAKIEAEIDEETTEIEIDAVVEGIDEIVIELSTGLLQTAQEKELQVSIDAGFATLEIPAASLGELEEGTVTLVLEKLSAEEAGLALAAMEIEEKEAVSELIYFDFSLNGEPVNFAGGITIIIDANVAEIDDSRKAGVYYLNEETGELEFVGGVVNEEDGTIAFTITHFSKYIAMEFSKTFVDIEIPWAQDYIEVLASRHVIKGVDADSFAPDNPITRAEVATLLVRALRLPLGTETVEFDDVSAGDWFEETVLIAASQGIVQGHAGSFLPRGHISREEMAIMIVRALKLAEPDDVHVPAVLLFEDEISDWARHYVGIAFDKEIIKGISATQFGARDNATRAQAAVMIYRLLESLGEF